MADGQRGRNAVGAAAFFVAMPCSVAGLLPYLMTQWQVERQLPTGVRVGGLLLIAAGVTSVVESFVRFVGRGQGTPAPVAPPEHLVVTGQYRHVRNPMYVALVFVVLGQAALLGASGLVAYATLLLVLFHLHVVMYEEPQLAKLFGAAFEAYRKGVPRWLPRLTGWNASTAGTVEQSADRRTSRCS
jgi:protein-S-isoprenylcysteine O-methyltransferase Ste14